jgi:hypothetical protein
MQISLDQKAKVQLGIRKGVNGKHKILEGLKEAETARWSYSLS